MRSVAEFAAHVICNSNHTEAEVRRVFGHWGYSPKTLVAPLGASLSVPQKTTIPTPYFLCLGTIEPRKNHLLLLDIWERWGDAAPHLVIVGRRGWENTEVKKRLDANPTRVLEFNDLTDGQVAGLLEGACAVLFPSWAEGYGLPAAEAAAFGTPLVCSDLAVFREVVEDYPVYVNPSDAYAWAQTIKRMALEQRLPRNPRIPPTWEAHFNRVLTLL